MLSFSNYDYYTIFILNIFLDCSWTGDNTCGGTNGKCVEDSGTFACVCNNGFSGDQCDTAPTGNRLIIMYVESPERKLDTNYERVLLLSFSNYDYYKIFILNIFLDCSWTGDNTCGGTNGKCVEDSGTFACVCNNGFSGDQCDTAPTGKRLIIMYVESPESKLDTNYERVLLSFSNYDYYTIFILNMFLDCSWTGDNTCGGTNGNCVEDSGTFSCVCNNGFSGDPCDTAPTGKRLIIMYVQSPERKLDTNYDYCYHLAIMIIIQYLS